MLEDCVTYMGMLQPDFKPLTGVKILGIPMKMGTLDLHFPGKFGTPFGRWGPPAFFMARLYCECSILKSLPVYIELVLNQPVAISFIANPDWRQHFGTRTAIFVTAATPIADLKFGGLAY